MPTKKPDQPAGPNPVPDKPLTRWPPWKGFDTTGLHHPPRGYCAPNRCYCTQCPTWEPLPPIRPAHP